MGEPRRDPCRSRNSNDCCDTVLNCDQRRELELALSRAVQRLKTAKSKLGKTIIERQLRQIFRQLMGRRRFKEQVVNRIEDAYKWLDNATIAKRGDSPPVDSESSTNHEEEILREAKPDDDIEFPHDIGEAPLENVPPPKQPKQLKPSIPSDATPPSGLQPEPGKDDDIELPHDIGEVPLENVPPPKQPKQLKPSIPSDATTPPSSLQPELEKIEFLKPAPSPCPEGEKIILCSLPCDSSSMCTDSNTLAVTADGSIWVCPSAFSDSLKLEGTLIHEAMHNVLPGKERDIYVQTRLFRVLRHVRDPKGIVGSIARQNPDSYTALVMAASDNILEDYLKVRAANSKIDFEGFRYHSRQKVAPEVALGFASAGILKASSQVNSLRKHLNSKSKLSSFSISDEHKETSKRLLHHDLLLSRISHENVATHLERLTVISNNLDKMKEAVNSVGSIEREDSFVPASYLYSTLKVSKRFFALSSQHSQAQEVILAFVNSISLESSAQVLNYARFIDESISFAKGLSDLPYSSSKDQKESLLNSE